LFPPGSDCAAPSPRRRGMNTYGIKSMQMKYSLVILVIAIVFFGAIFYKVIEIKTHTREISDAIESIEIGSVNEIQLTYRQVDRFLSDTGDIRKFLYVFKKYRKYNNGDGTWRQSQVVHLRIKTNTRIDTFIMSIAPIYVDHHEVPTVFIRKDNKIASRDAVMVNDHLIEVLYSIFDSTF
jgi:hypothetical protein